ncbi:PQ loop repeat-domain-containing protein [Phycomyces blakesleeanus]|uniref:PQ loop repeat-domain-containing protein n=1 Tax=Phycomyces blakesleeanus TaxID=4837 RepID=A0ABR3B0D2_PHYBL
MDNNNNQCLPTQNDMPYIQWIHALFGECVYGTQGATSLLLGYMSMAFWFNAQLPQLITNYRKSSAEGLSLPFLFIWLLGDTANLIGCILTHQLPFQQYLGMYFVSVDVCLLVQWIYYNKFSPPNHLSDTAKEYEYNRAKINGSSAGSNKASAFLFSIFLLGSRLPAGTLTSTTFTTIASAETSITDDPLIIGRIFAWTCTCLYLMSRIPQIRKNYKRQSVEGLSPSLFIFAVGGNLTYALSILTHPGQTLNSLLDALPYLIGSAGTLSFDATIFIQFFWYKRRDTSNNLNIV